MDKNKAITMLKKSVKFYQDKAKSIKTDKNANNELVNDWEDVQFHTQHLSEETDAIKDDSHDPFDELTNYLGGDIDDGVDMQELILEDIDDADQNNDFDSIRYYAKGLAKIDRKDVLYIRDFDNMADVRPVVVPEIEGVISEIINDIKINIKAWQKATVKN